MNRGIALPYFQSEWGMAYTQQETQNISARGSKSAGTISNSTILIFCCCCCNDTCCKSSWTNVSAYSHT